MLLLETRVDFIYYCVIGNCYLLNDLSLLLIRNWLILVTKTLRMSNQSVLPILHRYTKFCTHTKPIKFIIYMDSIPSTPKDSIPLKFSDDRIVPNQGTYMVMWSRLILQIDFVWESIIRDSSKGNRVQNTPPYQNFKNTKIMEVDNFEFKLIF